MTARRLPHGYTNVSWVEDQRVVKQYQGVDAEERLRTEVAALARAAGAVPLPEVIEVDMSGRRAVLTFMGGRHGQELVDEGFAPQILSAAGRTLRLLHGHVPGMVHGDYGPQNLLFDTTSWKVSAVLDWEFAHDGEPIEDLAWAEWIIRMHHPAAVRAIPSLFEGYGEQPAWRLRQDAMRDRCSRLSELCERRGQREAMAMWHDRERITRAWRA